jgi:hypothetical protein
VTDVPTWVLLVLRIASGNQYGKSHSRESPNWSESDTYIITFPLEFFHSYFPPMSNLSELYFPPPSTDNKPPPRRLYWTNYIESAEAYWRQESYSFITYNLGVIAQPDPITQVHMSQFNQLRFPPPVPIYQPDPPALPLWRHLAVGRIQSFCFIHHSNIIHLAEPDKSTERSHKRRGLNQPLFPPLSHLYSQSIDPLQAVIKSEEPTENH